MTTELLSKERTLEEIEAGLDGIGALVVLHHAITGKDCPRHLAVGMATAAVSSLQTQLGEMAQQLIKSADRNGELILQLEEATAHVHALEAERRLLTKPNGAFTPEVFDQVLITGDCGVGGHFRFQRNGNTCMMCQREAQAIEAFRLRAIEAARMQSAHNVSESMYQDRAGQREKAAVFAMKAMGNDEVVELLQSLPATEDCNEK